MLEKGKSVTKKKKKKQEKRKRKGKKKAKYLKGKLRNENHVKNERRGMNQAKQKMMELNINNKLLTRPYRK